jgi:hypothetical protein
MDQSDIDNRFAYHKPTTEDVGHQHEWIRNATGSLAGHLNARLPECREKSLAITKLEEVMMWANAAIARNQ